jgi:hypothetical protein
MLMLGACASAANDPSLTPAQRALREQNGRFNETVGTGAVAGALLGAVIGALLAGNNRGNRAGGIAIGAAAGAALGGGAGYYIGTRNERFASREEAAQARLEAAQREGADLARTAMLSEEVARENEAKLADAERRLAAGAATRTQLAGQVRSAENDLALIRQGIDHSRKVEGAMRQDGLPGEAARVAQSREQMEESAARLRQALSRARAA